METNKKTTTQTTRTKSTSTKTTTTKPNVVPEVILPQILEEPVRAKRFDRHDEILVKSCCPTPLGFISRRNPLITAFWGSIGDIQYLEYESLLEMAVEQPKFFSRNWIIIPDDVLESLRMDKFYTNALTVEEYGKVFELPIDVMKKKLESVPEGQKVSLSMKARAMYQNGEIDSRKKATVIEEALGTKISEEF